MQNKIKPAFKKLSAHSVQDGRHYAEEVVVLRWWRVWRESSLWSSTLLGGAWHAIGRLMCCLLSISVLQEAFPVRPLDHSCCHLLLFSSQGAGDRFIRHLLVNQSSVRVSRFIFAQSVMLLLTLHSKHVTQANTLSKLSHSWISCHLGHLNLAVHVQLSLSWDDYTRQRIWQKVSWLYSDQTKSRRFVRGSTLIEWGLICTKNKILPRMG